MLSDPLRFIEDLRATHGPVVGMLLGGERVVLLSDPPAARQALIDRADVFVKEGTAFFPGSALTGNGLLVSDGEVWRRQRRLSNPAFRRAAVEGYAHQMVVETQRLMRGPFAGAAAAAAAGGGGGAVAAATSGIGSPRRRPLVSRGPDTAGLLDVYAEFNKLTLSITLAALFGLSEGSGDAPAAAASQTTTPSSRTAAGSSSNGSSSTAARVVAAVERAFAFFANRGAAAMVVPEWVPTPDNLEFGAAVGELDDLVYGIIGRRRDALRSAAAEAAAAAGGTGGGQAGAKGGAGEQQQDRQLQGWPDLLQALLESVDDDGSGGWGGEWGVGWGVRLAPEGGVTALYFSDCLPTTFNPTHQHTNTPTHQHTNTPTHQASPTKPSETKP